MLTGLAAGSGVLLLLRGVSSLNIPFSMDDGVQLREEEEVILSRMARAKDVGGLVHSAGRPSVPRACVRVLGALQGSLRLARIP